MADGNGHGDDIILDVHSTRHDISEIKRKHLKAESKAPDLIDTITITCNRSNGQVKVQGPKDFTYLLGVLSIAEMIVKKRIQEG